MAVVKDYYDGNTHFIIKDDSYCITRGRKNNSKKVWCYSCRQYYSE
ncbi:hypothetical protein [Clostridium sp. KNHs205]|nr:hypothetical protein [Clostridium sp. KNHs205]